MDMSFFNYYIDYHDLLWLLVDSIKVCNWTPYVKYRVNNTVVFMIVYEAVKTDDVTYHICDPYSHTHYYTINGHILLWSTT